MTASLSDQPTPGSSAVPVDLLSGRAVPQSEVVSHVVSVPAPSPDDLARRHDDDSLERRAFFLAPQVIDRAAFDELAGALRTLIDQATSTRSTLEGLLGDLGEAEPGATAASRHLQERLQLGARMLKAFQGQITRIEAAIESVQVRQRDAERLAADADTCLDAFEQRTREVMAGMDARLDGLAGEILKRFESHLEQRYTEMRDELDRSAAALSRERESATRCIESVRQQETATERAVDASMERLAKAGRGAEHHARSAGHIIERCDAARDELAADIDAFESRINAALSRAATVQTIVDGATAEGIAAMQSISRALRDMADGLALDLQDEGRDEPSAPVVGTIARSSSSTHQSMPGGSA